MILEDNILLPETNYEQEFHLNLKQEFFCQSHFFFKVQLAILSYLIIQSFLIFAAINY